MAKKISVIIPSRNEMKNLLWTLQCVQNGLDGTDYEMIPVLNLCENGDVEKLEKYWPSRNGTMKAIRYDDKPSCWQARNAGAAVAEGKYLLFLDSHVAFQEGAIRALLDFHEGWKGIAHLPLCYWLEENRPNYGYVWKPEKFWGNWTRQMPDPPYDVPLSGASSILIDRDVFEEIGGFHSSLGIYGGGETYLDLKVQMFGYKVRVAVGYKLFHMTEKRGYAWNKKDFQRNFMLSAYALGGYKYLDPLYDVYFEDCRKNEVWENAMVELREEAIAIAQDDRDFIEANAEFTLDEVIEKWEV